MTELNEKLIEEIKELVLEIRQYLCNTEFAPEPFKEPVDANVLRIEFPKKIIQAIEPLIRQDEREKMVEWLQKHCRGYHRGNYGGELGHFAIFRKEFEALKKGVK